jgi:hypothetical protein
MRAATIVAALVLSVAALAGQARADELLVGALRDQDGRPVAGAMIVARDAAGRVVGRDRSSPDGTFAIDAPARPAALDIAGDETDPRHLRVPPGGPVIALLYRHRAADLVPSSADLAALPAGSLSALASVIPERVTGYGSIADLGAGSGYGALTIAGLPFYRRDGADATNLLPDHAVGTLTATDPLAAPWYGDRAGGGVIDADPFDRDDALRATDRDAVVAAGADPTGVLAESWDPDGLRQLAAVRASGMLGPLRASFVALDGTSPDADYGGLGLDLRGATQTLDLGAHVAFTRDAVPASYGPGPPDVGSVAELDLDAAARGPDALSVRLRWRDESDLLDDTSGDHDDAALVIGTTRGDAIRTTIAVALAYGSDRDGSTVRTGLAILPELSAVAPLDADWTLHAGVGDATIGTPGAAIVRSSLGEAGLAYDDHRRLLGDVLAFTDAIGTPQANVRGYGASLGWEFAPRLSLRGWALSNGTVTDELIPGYDDAPATATTVDSNERRQLLWLTWDAPVRIDLLLRSGAVEGALRIPLSTRYALSLGSSRRGTVRILSLGLVGR